MCAGAYLACDGGNGSFTLGLVPGCKIWPHTLWDRGDRLSGTISLHQVFEHADVECDYSNGALFDPAGLPDTATVVSLITKGLGTAAQCEGLQGKAIVVSAPSQLPDRRSGKEEPTTPTIPATAGRVVLCGCHPERFTDKLRNLAGVLETLVEHALPPPTPTQRSSTGFACACRQCSPAEQAAEQAERAERRRAIRTRVDAMAVSCWVVQCRWILLQLCDTSECNCVFCL